MSFPDPLDAARDHRDRRPLQPPRRRPRAARRPAVDRAHRLNDEAGSEGRRVAPPGSTPATAYADWAVTRHTDHGGGTNGPSE